MRTHAFILMLIVAAVSCLFLNHNAIACTGIVLKGDDGTHVAARTFEWGAFDWKSQLMVVPRGHKIDSHTPDGKPGLVYTTKYGVVGMDIAGELGIADGMNEKGLVVGAFYLPGFAEFQPYDSSMANQSMSPIELMLYLLAQFKSVDEVRDGLAGIRVVPVVLDSLGFAPPIHYRVVDKAGKTLIIEYVKGGELTLFDAPLGTITNSPTYDWHLTNLRNYIGLSKVGHPERKIEGLTFGAFGAGSGMFGLPGDTTPPSRFVQAVAYTQTARATQGGLDTVNEAIRILDNFNLPMSGAEGADLSIDQQIPSATQWTTAADTKNKMFYYHTGWNRRLRVVDLKDINFSKVKFHRIPQDKDRLQDIEKIDIH